MSSILISGFRKNARVVIRMICYIIVFHTRVQIPFFPLLITFHLIEIYYRLIYLTMSLILTYIIVLFNSDIIMILFTPNIKTLILYSNIIDGIILKWTFALYISLFFLTPYLLFSIWAFFRPGIFLFQDFNPVFWFFIPSLLYFSLLYIYNNYILVLAETGLWWGQFLPTFIQIVLLTKNMVLVSLLITTLITALKFFTIKNLYIN